MIVAKNLTKTYTQGEENIVALDNANLTINPGDFIAVVGKSGSGKSTLLNIIAGLTMPTTGTVHFNGQDIAKLPDTQLSALRNSQIGCIPQVPSVISSLSVLDNVRLPYHLAKREGDSTTRALELLEMVELKKLAKRMPKRLSGGQLKRVCIARALINNPPLLLIDEPTGDLDEKTTTEIMGIFKNLTQEGTAILMVTHDLDTVKYATSCYEMASGVLTVREVPSF